VRAGGQHLTVHPLLSQSDICFVNMSSSVHFKFKSQKEPSRVTFDGTAISVFDLKREIITINRLGDGTDFELAIYNESDNTEYDDDTTLIPRSTSVIARRLPAIRPGRGGAARYVSGKAPVNARHISANDVSKSNATTSRPRGPDMSTAQTEEERVKAMFNLEGEQWRIKQQEMAT
jgi:protein MPE1